MNLPVRSVAASRAFFIALGFRLSDRWTDDTMACLLFGDPPFVVNLFPVDTFAGFVRTPVTVPATACEVLISLGASSREQVDEFTEKARRAGAIILSEAAETDGWMYGSAFIDPDGHRWNWLWCDPARMPKAR